MMFGPIVILAIFAPGAVHPSPDNPNTPMQAGSFSMPAWGSNTLQMCKQTLIPDAQAANPGSYIQCYQRPSGW